MWKVLPIIAAPLFVLGLVAGDANAQRCLVPSAPTTLPMPNVSQAQPSPGPNGGQNPGMPGTIAPVVGAPVGPFPQAFSTPIDCPIGPPPPTTIALGENTVLSDSDCCNAGLIVAQDAMLSKAGTLQSLWFYAQPDAIGQMQLGLYDATGTDGGPGALIAQTLPFVVQPGWNGVSISSIHLASATYWLAYEMSDNFSFPIERIVGTCVWAAQPFTSMPLTFPALNGSDTCHWSFYGTVSVL